MIFVLENYLNTTEIAKDLGVTKWQWHIKELTQQDSWKTQEGRKTKKYRLKDPSQP